MLSALIIVLSTVSAVAFGVFFASGVKVKVGWQSGSSPLARYLNARRRAKFDAQLPEALATMTNALRAGFSISQAFESVVEQGVKPMSEEFEVLQHQLRIGMSLEDALESLSERVGSDDLTLVTTAILISRKTGGNVTEIFDKISETIRGRMRIERKVRTLTAQGRLQGIVVSAMPFFLALVMTLLKPRMMLPFFGSAIGVAAIVATSALVAVGWLIIRKIVKIDV